MDVLGVVQTAMALQSQQTATTQAVTVAKRGLDIQRQIGEQAVALIQNSAVPPLLRPERGSLSTPPPENRRWRSSATCVTRSLLDPPSFPGKRQRESRCGSDPSPGSRVCFFSGRCSQALDGFTV
jgi:hypothetical protein